MKAICIVFPAILMIGLIFVPGPVRADETYGDIIVRSDPAGALVSLDGLPTMFPTPYQYYGVKTGRHSLKITRQGYIPYTNNDVIVSSGRTNNVYVVLLRDRDYGTIRVSSSVPDADVYVDGVFMGKAPESKGQSINTDSIRISDLLDGMHLVVIKKEGYDDFTSQVQTGTEKDADNHVIAVMRPVAQNQTRSQNQTVPLPVPSAEKRPAPPAGGILVIESNPAGARILMNGTIQGVTPHTIAPLPSGAYTFSLQRSGYVPITTTVEIKTGETASRSIILSPLPPTRSPTPLPITSLPTTPSQTAAAPVPTRTSGPDFITGGFAPGLIVIWIGISRRD